MANQYTLKNGGYEPFIGNFGLVPQPPIPEPAAEDNGKVLGVSNGSYALVNGGGGGGGTVEPLIVTPITENESTHLDKTFAEIESAYLSGQNVLLKMEVYQSHDEQTQIFYYPLVQLYEVVNDEGVSGSEYFTVTFYTNEYPLTASCESKTEYPVATN
jgi:hypothetical protein